MIDIPRRRFIGSGAAAAFGWLAGCAKPPDRSLSYSVPVLGDIHFDSTDPKHYHSDYTHSTTEKRYKEHLAEHVRNARNWKERMPELIRASGACLRGDEAFALQMGDFVQGDCGNAATHRRMLNDAFAIVKGAYGNRLPLVTVVGNHDIRGDIKGDGALETFDAWQPPLMSKELGVSVQGTTYSFRHGPDAYVVVDFNAPRPDLALVKKLIAETEGARHLFVVSHGAAIPFGSKSRWYLLGSRKRDAERRELRSVLARHNAIVLSGHSHRLEYYDCVFPEGRITQFVFNSVWSKDEKANLHVIGKGADEYGKQATGDGADVKEYRPFVRDYLFADAAGHYRMDVSDDRVEVVFYPGAATSPTETFRLR